jgi:Na+-transporting NADH:ubiquinone oxidoreductase subunit C
MKKKYGYTIIFMFAFAFVFTLILASVNAVYKDKIALNEQLQEKRAVLNAMNIAFTDKDIDDIFKDVEEINEDDLLYYIKRNESGQIISYALHYEGTGLWGSLIGYIGFNDKLDALIGIDFTYQNETPGLGGRIEELWYKNQFKGVSIASLPLTYGNGIDAITGATSTSNAVMKTINDTINNQLVKVVGNK